LRGPQTSHDVPAISRILTGFIATLEAVVRPWLDLAIRLWLAQAFFGIQLEQMMAGNGVRGRVETHGLLSGPRPWRAWCSRTLSAIPSGPSRR
jgi:hypothetical protein